MGRSASSDLDPAPKPDSLTESESLSKPNKTEGMDQSAPLNVSTTPKSDMASNPSQSPSEGAPKSDSPSNSTLNPLSGLGTKEGDAERKKAAEAVAVADGDASEAKARYGNAYT
jgi:hypothetical protein